jgi:elongation factor Ts
MVKELRERTQAGMGQCKDALVEAEGDMDKAVEIILKKGLAKTAKRATAVAAEGDIRTWVSPDASFGVMIEVNIQTDFAARNDKFVAFVDQVLEVAKGAKDGEDLTTKPYPGSDKTVAQVRDELIAQIGEKIDVRRYTRYDLSSPAGAIHAYRHMNGKHGVLLEASAENEAVAKNPAFVTFIDDTTMQICAMNPQYLDRTKVPEADIAKQREIYTAQMKEDPKPKPEAAWPKIIEGKVNKWFSEICLVEQDSVQESQKTVEERRAEAAKAAGGAIKLVRFTHFERGEGLTKKVDDFADEARKMAGT